MCAQVKAQATMPASPACWGGRPLRLPGFGTPSFDGGLGCGRLAAGPVSSPRSLTVL